MVSLWEGWRQRKSAEGIAEGDRAAAAALEREKTTREILTRVNRFAADADASADNAIMTHHNYFPLGELRSFTGASSGENARTEADSYLLGEDFGQSVTHLRACLDIVVWSATQNPDDFAGKDSATEIVALRTAAEQVKARVQGELKTL